MIEIKIGTGTSTNRVNVNNDETPRGLFSRLGLSHEHTLTFLNGKRLTDADLDKTMDDLDVSGCPCPAINLVSEMKNA